MTYVEELNERINHFNSLFKIKYGEKTKIYKDENYENN